MHMVHHHIVLLCQTSLPPVLAACHFCNVANSCRSLWQQQCTVIAACITYSHTKKAIWRTHLRSTQHLAHAHCSA
jgi:hypothetical protein